MTTLFPQIKRVSEDETSKIIKNVLFSDQDESRLEQIFEEFTHLTKETITFSDVEFSIEDDEEEDDEDEANDDEGKNDDDDDDGEEDDDDEDDDDDDEDDDDDSGSSSDSDEEEASTARSPSPIQPQASREPTSWNLDQFIPVTTKQSPTPPKQSPTPPKKSPTPPKQSPTRSKQSPTRPKQSPTISKRSPTIPKRSPAPIRLSPKPAKRSPTPTKRSPTPTKRSPTPTKAIVDAPISDAKTQPPQSQQPESPKTQKTSSSCIVQIDLSKLKRIPATKAPTPTTSVSSNSLLTAKALKHEADGEKDRTKQTIKYLESAMYFVLHGYELELANNTTAYYHETIPLFKYVIRLSAPENVKNPDNMTHVKIHALALRCLSVLHFRLYKLQERALHDAAKTIQQHSQNSPIQQVDGLLVGIRPQLHSAYKKQIAIFNELKNAHDKWHNVEHLCDLHPALRIFFSTIESNCGPLTMVSSFSKLMEHVKCGLKLLRTS